MYLIGIDIGTQGTKTAVFDEKGVCAADSFEPSNLISPSAGVVEQKASEIYSSVVNTIKSALEKAGIKGSEVAAVGIDGQMAGIMGVGADGEATTCYDSWLDTRCEKYIEIMKNSCEEEIIKTTGSPVSYMHGPKVAWWKNERSEQYNKTAKFVMPSTYAAMKLCGLGADKAYIDYTHLHFSGFGDVKNLRWSDALLREFDIDGDKMPDIVEPWRVVGGVCAAAAAQCGLTQGTPIVAGCGDQAATSLGAGVTKKGMSYDVSGTTNLLSFCTDEFSPDYRHKTFVYPRSIIDGLWIPLAYTNGSGMCLAWFREQLARDADSLRELDDEAEKISVGSEGLMFIPHFSGRVCPNNPNIRGSFTGLNWVHTRAHMYRAVVESIGYEYAYYARVLSELIGDIPMGDVRVIGGGSKSGLFNSIKSDILGRRYVTLDRGDSAPLGSAVLAGYGVGLYKDFGETMDGIVRVRSVIEPDMRRHGEYEKYAALYEQTITALGPIYAQQINN